MIERTKTVYYCEHCKKHGLSKRHMEAHERKCTRNPHRECNWKLAGHPHKLVDVPSLVEVLNVPVLNLRDIEWLSDETGSCPACMLAVLLQSGHTGDVMAGYGGGERIWNYEDAVTAWREREQEIIREETDEADRAALYA